MKLPIGWSFFMKVISSNRKIYIDCEELIKLLVSILKNNYKK